MRLSPNEVSFTSVSALREIYTSEGAGWDKTEFYDLFRQFGERYAHFDFILIFCLIVFWTDLAWAWEWNEC